MADINLKDEKRISVNGEYDLVTTHPNNEPIYRSNGHELELNSANSDYLDLNSSINIVNDGDYFKTVIEIDNSSEKLFISDESDLSSYISITNTGVFKIVSKGNFQQIIPSAPFNGKAYIKIYKSGGDIFFEVNGTTENKGAYNFIFDSIFFGKRTGSAFVSQKIILVDNNNESFNPTNINANAQIEGSNGTIAQVNSSAADPINYILGTVFQKSGFALALDSGNSEYVEVNENITLNTTDDIDLEISFIPSSFLNISYVLYKGKALTQTRFYLRRFTSTNYNFNINDVSSGLNQNISFTGITEGVLNTIKIKDRAITVNGVDLPNQIQAGNFDSSDLPSLRVFNGFEGLNGYFDGSIINIKYQGENYPLRRGLGVELIGSNGTTAEIKTSAANPQQRVNFGMWQKNGNVLKLNASNSDYLLLPSVQTLSSDGDYLEISFTLDSLGQTASIISETNVGDYLIILSDARLFISTDTGDSLNTLVVTDLDNVVKVTRTATGLDVTLNGVTETTILTTDFNYGQFFRRSSGYLGGNINYIKSNNESYLFREGNGLTTTSESGNTTATINTSAANPTDYIDTYVWNKDNNKFTDYKV